MRLIEAVKVAVDCERYSHLTDGQTIGYIKQGALADFDGDYRVFPELNHLNTRSQEFRRYLYVHQTLIVRLGSVAFYDIYNRRR